MPCVTYSMSFDPSKTYRHWFPSQVEILQYLHHVASKYKINDHLRLNTEVVNANWNDKTKMWTVVYRNSKTSELSEQQSKFLISAIGQLVEPSYGGIQGLDNFKGDVLHCSRWDGDVSLEGKDVVVIGNGGEFVISLRSRTLTLISFWCTGRPLHRTTSAKPNSIDQNTPRLFGAEERNHLTPRGMDV